MTTLLIGTVLGLGLPPSPFLAAPYLQLGDDDGRGVRKSLTVVWHTTQGTRNWAVRYRSASQAEKEVTPKAVSIDVGGMPKHALLEAKLGDLRPGEALKYRVLFQGKEVFSSASVAPKGPQQKWRMAVMGDTGRGTPGQRRVTAQLHRARPDAVLVPGDIVYPKGRMSEYGQFLFPIANADVTDPKVGAPSMRSTLWIGVTGNHDTAYRDLNANPDGLAFYTYWRQPNNGPAFRPAVRGNAQKLQAAAGERWGRSANFTFRYGNATFVALDSNTYANWKSGPLRTWVEGALSRAQQESDWVIVSFHHSCFHGSRKKKDEQYMRELAPLFSARGVDLVLTGHVHNYQRSRPIGYVGDRIFIDKSFPKQPARGPIYITTGAGGAELYDQDLADKPAAWPPYVAAYKKGFSFSLIQAEGKSLRFQQISDSGQILDEFKLTAR